MFKPNIDNFLTVQSIGEKMLDENKAGCSFWKHVEEVNRTGTEWKLSGHTHDDESGTDTKLCLWRHEKNELRSLKTSISF